MRSRSVALPSDPIRTILVVEDDAVTREMVAELLAEAGYEVAAAESAEQALAMIGEREFGVVLTDLQMPGMNGLELLVELREHWPHTPVLLMTAYASIETAIQATRAGAFDYIAKPFSSDALLLVLERALERRWLELENQRLRRVVERLASFGELVGKSAAMNEIYALIRKVASNRSNILISGESGTGKELVARTIHSTGPRAKRAWIPINCTALPEGLLESELFGHVKGAFTGAHTTKKGLLEEASGGTIFLDEIGDMPLALQGKLLRVLQEKEVRPVGSNQPVQVDARVIAATNLNLKQEVEDGHFREDLFYRLNVIPIRIPPLRERREDIPLLANAFLKKHAEGEQRAISDLAMRKLERAPWPGNARELENCIERALALAEQKVITESDVVIESDLNRSASNLEEGLFSLAIENRLTIQELSDRYIDQVLKLCGGQKTEAAKLLGINRRTLYRREDRLASED